MKVKAFVTAAGMGKRFGALTRATNKCLMRVEGKPLIAHILDKLERAGVPETVVVTGYQNHAVERCLGRRAKALFNPFYRVSGILASFWEARPSLAGKPFLFTTSDHFFHPSVLRDCLRGGADVRIVVQRKKRYTTEDAKVIIRGLNVVEMGKGIPVSHAHGEFGGMAFFSARASALFYRELRAHFEKGDLGGYMMDILNTLRQRHAISIRYSVCAEDMRIEVDSVHDLVEARRLARLFKRRVR
jgi:choline kinase